MREMRWRFDTERLCPPSWRKGLFSSFTIPGGSFVDAREYKPGHDTTDRCSFSVRSSYPLSKVIRLLNTRKLEPFVYFRGGGGCLRFFLRLPPVVLTEPTLWPVQIPTQRLPRVAAVSAYLRQHTPGPTGLRLPSAELRRCLFRGRQRRQKRRAPCGAEGGLRGVLAR